MKSIQKQNARWRRESGDVCEIHQPRLPRWMLNRPRLVSYILGIALGVGLMAWGFVAEFPTGPQSGTELPGVVRPPVIPGKSIRVGTFNIHGGRGRDKKFDLGRTAAPLRELDLVGLNEVHHRSPWSPSQAEILGRDLQLNWLFAPTEYCWRGEHFGSALLSRLPISNWQRIPLENRETSGYRNLVLTQVPLAKGSLQVIITHIDRTADREHQLQSAFSLFSAMQPPAILMGDLNTRRDDPWLQPRLGSGEWIDCVGPLLTDDPPQRIDWILGRGVKPISAGLVDNGASDHPCVWAELDLSQ